MTSDHPIGRLIKRRHDLDAIIAMHAPGMVLELGTQWVEAVSVIPRASTPGREPGGRAACRARAWAKDEWLHPGGERRQVVTAFASAIALPRWASAISMASQPSTEQGLRG